MKRPSFQFYPADWKGNSNLRRCSEAARGAWMDILCVLHDSDEYGVVRWPLEELAMAAGVSITSANELAKKNVLKGSDSKHEGFTFTPTHAGQKGETVILIQPGDGPCWFSSRMVTDECIRHRRGNQTQFKPSPKPTPKPTIGGSFGDGPTSSSSSSSSKEVSSGVAIAPKPVSGQKKTPTLEEVKLVCEKAGIPESDAVWFWNKCQGNGWTNGGKPIKSYPHVLAAWKAAGYLPSQKNGNSNQPRLPGGNF